MGPHNTCGYKTSLFILKTKVFKKDLFFLTPKGILGTYLVTEGEYVSCRNFDSVPQELTLIWVGWINRSQAHGA